MTNDLKMYDWNSDQVAAMNWQQRMHSQMQAGRCGLEQRYGEDDIMFALRQEVCRLRADQVELLAQIEALTQIVTKFTLNAAPSSLEDKPGAP